MIIRTCVNEQIKNEIGLGGKKEVPTLVEVWNINSLCITGLGVAARRRMVVMIYVSM